MNDRPTAGELLDAVQRFLQEEVVPNLQGHRRYHARVAASVVGIVAREIESEEAQLLGEWRRLGELLQDPSEPPGERAALRDGVLERSQALALRIRRGEADAGPFRAAVLDHLTRTVEDKLAVARPRKS